MKTEIVGEFTQEKEIDWSKKQLMLHEETGLIILTNGCFNDEFFRGMIIKSETKERKIGTYGHSWIKASFNPITHPITIKFKNE